MSKDSTDNTLTLDISDWMFPQVDLTDANMKAASAAALSKKEADLNQRENAVAQREAQVNQLKIEYEEKIQIVNQIIAKAETPVAALDDELIELLNTVVKKAVKSIIYKEMKGSTTVLTDMINELSKLLKTNSSMITIQLSADDAKKVKSNQLAENTVIKVDEALATGDVVIQSSLGEVHAILDERLDKLIGQSNVRSKK